MGEADRCTSRPAAARHGTFSARYYVLSILLLAFPRLGQFSSGSWGDRTDDLQNAQNLWSVNRATRHPEQFLSIWCTDLLRCYVVTSGPLTFRRAEPYITLAALYDKKGIRIYRLGRTCEGS